uniref:O-fucosyltransferase family protein n=1 Tax=Kalanchoe fedtschenkoi TaxID=63787 RepID=A0A7N0TYR1_KALFE
MNHRDRDPSSGEDDDSDRETLIPQNKANGVGSKPSSTPPHSAFHIDDEFKPSRTRAAASRRSALTGSSKRYYVVLLAVLVPLVIVVLFLTTDLRSLFDRVGVGVSAEGLVSGRMREAELQAMELLRRQQLGLFSLWNRTLSSHPNSSRLNYTESDKDLLSAALFHDLKSAVLKQISLNKEIQQALLSAHQMGNVSDLGDGVVADPSFSGYDSCPKVDHRLWERRRIEWQPRLDKYLFAVCVSGQMSNHLICLEKHMFFAALLERVLVIPSLKVDYEFDRVIDVDHINKCLGRKVVVTFEEFAELKKNHMKINKFVCYFSSPLPCFMDDDHKKKLEALGISIGKIESAWTEDVKKPSKRTSQDVKAKFSSDDDVIAIGDVFFANVEEEWFKQPGGPLSHQCKTLIEPSRLIMLTAQRFVQTFLGENFVALHFRRHGFLKFCNAKQPSCFFPIPQAADCISRIVERANIPVIYLSTDAAESETGESDAGQDNLCNVKCLHWSTWINFHR